MFFLQGVKKGFVICKKGISTIGRINGDIVIKDCSISRRHAEIEERNGLAFLRDCNSKYFTKHNGRLLLCNEEIELQEGDRITFGEVQFVFHIGEKLVVCTTGSKENEQRIASILDMLGGALLKDWNNTCTHLTTSEILITLKVLLAIMDNKKIVVPNYWDVYLQNIRNGQVPPNAADYYPPLGESIINSSYVKYNPNRNSVFEGKTFGFWNKKKQLKIECVIKKAGGECIILGGLSDDNELIKLMEKCIVIDPEDAILEQKYFNILEKYKRFGKRLIPVQEIVLAILQCSCKENCNPSFNRAQAVFVKASQKEGSSKPIIPETQSQQFDIEMDVNPNVIASSDLEVSLPIKRAANRNLEGPVVTTFNETQLMTEETQLHAKRIKFDPDIEMNSRVGSSVRRHEDSSKRDTDSIFNRLIRECSPPPAKRLKKNMNMNPFDVIASTSKENPYNSIATEENYKIDLSNNPFGQSNIFKSVEVMSESVQDNSVKKVEDCSMNQPLLSKTVNTENPRVIVKTQKKSGTKLRPLVESAKLNYSNIKHDVSSGKWMKSNVELNDDSRITSQDEEERKWCEKFNNSVVIVVKDLLRKDRITEEQVNSQVSTIGSQVKNFKKFRKVPVPKSGVLIKCSGYVFGGSDLGVDYGCSDDEDNRDI